MYRTYVRRPLETNEYEILPKEMVLEETQLQKFRRLTFEVQELSNALDNDKVKKKMNGHHDTNLCSQCFLFCFVRTMKNQKTMTKLSLKWISYLRLPICKMNWVDFIIAS